MYSITFSPSRSGGARLFPGDSGFISRLWIYQQGGGLRCHAESRRCLEGRRDGESDTTGSQMVQGRVPVKVGQLRYPYRILHRASAKCLNYKLLPEDSRFISRLHIYQRTPDLPADKLTT